MTGNITGSLCIW